MQKREKFGTWKMENGRTQKGSKAIRTSVGQWENFCVWREMSHDSELRCTLTCIRASWVEVSELWHHIAQHRQQGLQRPQEKARRARGIENDTLEYNKKTRVFSLNFAQFWLFPGLL